MKKLHSLLKSLLPAALLVCLCAGAAAAQGAKVDLGRLVEETQRSSPEPDRMTLVWWIPEEFWRASFSQDASMTKAQTDAFVQTISPYMMFAIVDGKLGALGGVTYKSEEVIRGTIQVVDARGTVYRPLAGDKIDPDTRNLLAMMKPVLGNMMGKMGENMHFVVFPGKDAQGRRIADALKDGSLTLKMGADVFEWKLPLGSLLPPKVCPVDHEQMNGAWKFCPWHGEKLVPKPAKPSAPGA